MRRFRRVALGGTFDHLHRGHEALLATAFRVGRTVAIGVTSVRYLAQHPKARPGQLQSERARRAALARWLRARYPPSRWSLRALHDPWGGSVRPGIDALVVSAETVRGARAVNRERARRGLPLVAVVVVPTVLADDLGPIASRRVRSGAIDRDGRRRSRLRVGLVVRRPGDRASARRGIRRAFPSATVGTVPWATRTRSLAREAARAQRGRDLGLAVTWRPDGWWIAVRARERGLDPRRLEGRSSQALEVGVAEALRPGEA